MRSKLGTKDANTYFKQEYAKKKSIPHYANFKIPHNSRVVVIVFITRFTANYLVFTARCGKS
jgi:hypothetical protein